MSIVQLPEEGWVLVSDGRHKWTTPNRLPGAPDGTYHHPGIIPAEYLFSSDATALAELEARRESAGLGTRFNIRLRRKTHLVETEFPDGDYVDAFTPLRVHSPPADSTMRRIWGTAFGQQQIAGVVCPLDHTPPAAAAGYQVVTFLHMSTILPVVSEREL